MQSPSASFTALARSPRQYAEVSLRIHNRTLLRQGLLADDEGRFYVELDPAEVERRLKARRPVDAR